MGNRIYKILMVFGLIGLLLIGCTSPSEAAGPPASDTKDPPAAMLPPTDASPSGLPGSPSASPDSPSAPPASPSSAPIETAIYKGPVEHLFFHPLIIFPELAFDGDSKSQGYDNWFVTVPEFKNMLELLYERDYILIGIHDLYRTDTGGEVPNAAAQPLLLPKGKKPLILSVDDLNYYAYMRENGNAWRLVPGSGDGVTAFARTPAGADATDTNFELVPILDRFVSDHPDFSWNGAKGIIALTGYEGVLGYRTNDKLSPDYESEKAGALEVIRRLKKTGWSFASHSWGHLDVQKSSLARLKRDTARWKEEVGNLIGPTDIFIYPYGSSVNAGDPKFRYLREQGFAVFCSVGPAPYLQYKDGAMLMDRRHIDGISLRTQRKRLEPLFGDFPLLDPVRPPVP